MYRSAPRQMNGMCCGQQCSCQAQSSCGCGCGSSQSQEPTITASFLESLRSAKSCGQSDPCGDDVCETIEWEMHMILCEDPLWEGTVVGGERVNGQLVATENAPLVYTTVPFDVGEYDMYRIMMSGTGDNPELSWRFSKTADGLANQAYTTDFSVMQNFRYAQFRAIVRAV